MKLTPEQPQDLLDRFGSKIAQFLHTESAGGLLLLGAAVLAMVAKNSPLSELYVTFLNIEGELRVGALSVEKPLFLWVNDFQMAIFFFLIGLEIKREFLHGHLADLRQVVLPAAGAVGGIAMPALIYLSLNAGDPAATAGWAVPAATDIAFALGVLALVGPGIPASLRVFLMTLAILDDLVAIVVIALFYTSGVSAVSLSLATGFIAILFIMNRLRVMHVAAYILVGIALWVCVLKSGVHATLAGVVTALFIPSPAHGDDVDNAADRLIDMLHPWVAFGILPLFAFVNAGVALEGMNFARIFEPIPLGIGLGLLIGKPIGVMLMVGACVLFGLARLPPDVRWSQMLGIGFLCGIGFTMSLFIGGLAFAEGGPGYARIERLGMLAGSFASALIGFAILRWTLRGNLATSTRAQP